MNVVHENKVSEVVKQITRIPTARRRNREDLHYEVERVIRANVETVEPFSLFQSGRVYALYPDKHWPEGRLLAHLENDLTEAASEFQDRVIQLALVSTQLSQTINHALAPRVWSVSRHGIPEIPTEWRREIARRVGRELEVILAERANPDRVPGVDEPLTTDWTHWSHKEWCRALRVGCALADDNALWWAYWRQSLLQRQPSATQEAVGG